MPTRCRNKSLRYDAQVAHVSIRVRVPAPMTTVFLENNTVVAQVVPQAEAHMRVVDKLIIAQREAISIIADAVSMPNS